MSSTRSPHDVQIALSEELGVPQLHEDLAADHAAFAQIEHIAAERCHRDALSQQALETCGLLHASGQTRREEGYLPQDTVDEAVAKGSEVHRQRSHAAWVLEQRRDREMAR